MRAAEPPPGAAAQPIAASYLVSGYSRTHKKSGLSRIF